MFSENCMFNRTCKNKNTEQCNKYCYPFIMLHGQNGEGGFWASTGVPRKYRKNLAGNLPIKSDNPKEYEVILKFIANIESFVEDKGVGLFLFSVPNKDNPFGTGTGKTTTATTIINEYVLHSVKKHLMMQKTIGTVNPALFVKASELQNKYNAQFRGSVEHQQEASNSFYRLKERMKKVPLLAIDDIAMRDTTEAFKNELYEIIDHRATEDSATLFTSNYPIQKVAEFLGDRIASRIDGMTYKLGFKGQDHRKGGLF